MHRYICIGTYTWHLVRAVVWVAHIVARTLCRTYEPELGIGPVLQCEVAPSRGRLVRTLGAAVVIELLPLAVVRQCIESHCTLADQARAEPEAFSNLIVASVGVVSRAAYRCSEDLLRVANLAREAACQMRGGETKVRTTRESDIRRHRQQHSEGSRGARSRAAVIDLGLQHRAALARTQRASRRSPRPRCACAERPCRPSPCDASPPRVHGSRAGRIAAWPEKGGKLEDEHAGCSTCMCICICMCICMCTSMQPTLVASPPVMRRSSVSSRARCL
jgi:hypothetical protein